MTKNLSDEKKEENKNSDITEPFINVKMDDPGQQLISELFTDKNIYLKARVTNPRADASLHIIKEVTEYDNWNKTPFIFESYFYWKATSEVSETGKSREEYTEVCKAIAPQILQMPPMNLSEIPEPKFKK